LNTPIEAAIPAAKVRGEADGHERPHPLPELLSAGFTWEYPGFYARGDWSVGTPEHNEGVWVCQHTTVPGDQPSDRSFDTSDVAAVIEGCA
jgi:hypothetical protein